MTMWIFNMLPMQFPSPEVRAWRRLAADEDWAGKPLRNLVHKAYGCTPLSASAVPLRATSLLVLACLRPGAYLTKRCAERAQAPGILSSDGDPVAPAGVPVGSQSRFYHFAGSKPVCAQTRKFPKVPQRRM